MFEEMFRGHSGFNPTGARKARPRARAEHRREPEAITHEVAVSFMTAAVELSTTIMLVTAQNDAPMSYGIYLYMQSAAGRGPGAALGVLAVVLVAAGTYLSHRLIGRAGGAQPHEIQKIAA